MAPLEDIDPSLTLDLQPVQHDMNPRYLSWIQQTRKGWMYLLLRKER